MNSHFAIGIIASTVLLAACASPISDEAKREISAPVNCSTAKEDLAVLEKEKTSVAGQAAAGVTSVLPIGLVAGLVSGTADDKAKVATGEYNDLLDRKIAKIKKTCGVE
jgi:hypothetical protein